MQSECYKDRIVSNDGTKKYKGGKHKQSTKNDM